LIALWAVVLAWQTWFYSPDHNLPDLGVYWVASDFGLVPSALFGGDSSGPEWPWLRLVTYSFLHADLFHLIGNAVFLWIFGPGLEATMGRVRFLLFYILCGVIAGLGQACMDPSSMSPAIGASGAVSGVLGAFVLFYPRAKVVFLTHPAIHLGPIRGSCPLVLGLFFLVQWGYAFLNTWLGLYEGLGYWAHIGGFLAGMGLARLFYPRSIALFRKDSPPAA
jgi:membrane associated rhomboid family serine protease